MSTSGEISWVHRGMFSTSEGYHDTCGGIPWVHRGDTMSTRGISWVHRGDIMSISGDVQYIGVFNRNWKDFIKLLPHIPPMYWTSLDVLMISPRCTHGIPPMYWTSLMYSWYPLCTHGIPHIHHDIPRCTHHIPQCTEHPPMYWTSPDVLNTHYTVCWCVNQIFDKNPPRIANWVLLLTPGFHIVLVGLWRSLRVVEGRSLALLSLCQSFSMTEGLSGSLE